MRGQLGETKYIEMKTEQRLQKFQHAYGTALFFEDPAPKKDFQGRFKAYAQHFDEWSHQGSGMVSPISGRRATQLLCKSCREIRLIDLYMNRHNMSYGRRCGQKGADATYSISTRSLMFQSKLSGISMKNGDLWHSSSLAVRKRAGRRI